MALSPLHGQAANELRQQRGRFLLVGLSAGALLMGLQALGSPYAAVRLTGGAAAATFSGLVLAWRRGLISQRTVGALAGAAATAMLVVRMTATVATLDAEGAIARTTIVGLSVQTFTVPALLAGVVLGTRLMLGVHAFVGVTVVLIAFVVPPGGVWTREVVSIGAGTQMVVLIMILSAMIHVLNASTLSMEESEERARLAADTDPLTGLSNRRFLQRVLRIPAQGSAGGVLMVDIDHFKAINDTLGHEAGDDVLVEVAQTLAQVVRPEDAVGRWGGEEFLVVVRQGDVRVLIEVAERIRTAVEHMDSGAPGGTTVSVGAAVRRADDDAEALVARADRALYVAKEAGRNVVATADRVADGDEPTVV